jgi:hypothetical protein
VELPDLEAAREEAVSAAGQILRNGAAKSLCRDAQLEQLAMHLGGTPQRVLKTHSSDQVAHFFGDLRPAYRCQRTTVSGLTIVIGSGIALLVW